jgi:peptidoglycan/xylan/chitin deacetylase (PgdA/CDA1 family)
VLSEIPADAQREEIRQSKSHLEEILGEPVKSFAYPFGAHTEETARIVEEAGYDCACTTLPDIVWTGSHRYQLPRIDVGDWDGDRFARHIRQLALG